MTPKKILTLVLFLSAGCLFLIYGFSKEVKTFSVIGEIKFEGEAVSGTKIVYTTGDDYSLGKASSNVMHEILIDDGKFHRPINESGGEFVNIWIHKNGYPTIHCAKVLDGADEYIDFGEILIPKKFKQSKADVVTVNQILGYKNPCLEGQAHQIDPNNIKCILNFKDKKLSTGRCSSSKPKRIFTAHFSDNEYALEKIIKLSDLSGLFFGI